ncbi:MAG: SRPBCC family protein [Verrucomicrobia bacterium]|nr:SRPBCC family protein [Verrucomicrobiota bacterium]
MIKKILLSLVAIIVIILAAAALKSPDYRVERSRTIAAKPEVLFDYFNNHKKFNEWNPWIKMDPAAKNTYTGPEAGEGAVASWDAENVGACSATITESKPGELVRERMDWKKPMEGTSTVDFIFKTTGDKTTVTWAMYGRNENIMCKVMSLFMSCESMCGPEFEKGLADLEKLVTATPAK